MEKFKKELKEQGLKALTWKQPYLQLMEHGKIETRVWKTKYRGWVLMCSSKVPFSPELVEKVSGPVQARRIPELLKGVDLQHTLGHATHIGKLVDCVDMLPFDDDKCFVEYREGLYCLIFENVRAIEPIPWKGGQRFLNVPDEVIDKIKFI